MSQWHPYEDGETIGMTGAEGGQITADEQHDGGARITLERDCLHAPYAITSTIYGWLYHTRFIADEPTAKQAYNDMKPALEAIVALLPQSDADGDETPDAEQMEQAVADFAEEFA